MHLLEKVRRRQVSAHNAALATIIISVKDHNIQTMVHVSASRSSYFLYSAIMPMSRNPSRKNVHFQ